MTTGRASLGRQSGLKIRFRVGSYCWAPEVLWGKRKKISSWKKKKDRKLNQRGGCPRGRHNLEVHNWDTKSTLQSEKRGKKLLFPCPPLEERETSNRSIFLRSKRST